MRISSRVVWVIVIALSAGSVCQAMATDYGTIIVRKTAEDAGNIEFDFASPQLGDFTLTDGDSITFDDIFPMDYTVQELTTPGWELYLVVANSNTTAATDMVDWATSIYYLQLDPGEVVELTFHNQPTTPPVPAPSAVLLTSLGTAVIGFLRRRRSL